jgi:aspartyl protease family protein
MLAWLLIVLAGLVGLFYLLSGDASSLSELSGGNIAYMIAGGALIVLYLMTVSADYRGRAGTALRHVAIWLGIGLAFVTAYAYRSELTTAAYRVVGEIVPPGQVVDAGTGENGERSVRLRRHPNGHFLARASVNGVTLSMLVDTGASTVVLKPADAERAGVDTSNLNYSVAVSTANGTTYAAPVRLKSVSVGPLELRDVEALVAKPGNLSDNLLGMSFLRRLRSYEFSGDFLTLRG